MTTFWAVLLIVAGIVALLMPLLVGIGVAVLMTWLVLAAGVVHLVHAFSERGGALVWHLLIGAAYIVGGVYMLLHPAASLASLTLVVGALFIVEGLLRLVAFARLRRQRGAAWLLGDGVLTLLLGLLIAATWPLSSIRVPGTLLAISLLSSGISRLLHRRHAAAAVLDGVA